MPFGVSHRSSHELSLVSRRRIPTPTCGGLPQNQAKLAREHAAAKRRFRFTPSPQPRKARLVSSGVLSGSAPTLWRSRFRGNLSYLRARPLVCRRRSKGTVRRLSVQSTVSNHCTDDRSDDRPGHEVREPMDGHGDTDPNIKSAGNGRTSQPSLFRKRVKIVRAIAKAIVV